jgi:hypothetical protein
LSIRKCFPVETDLSGATVLRAISEPMAAPVGRQDLSSQSFIEHATLFLPRFNTEFVSTDKSG